MDQRPGNSTCGEVIIRTDPRTGDVFTYDSKRRIYRLNGIRLWSVTDILSDLGVCDLTYVTEQDLKRGQSIHEGCQYLEEGTIDWDSVQKSENAIGQPIVNRVHAYGRFLTETGWVSDQMEHAMYHPQFLYGLKPDRIGRFRGGARSVLEIKSALAIPVHTDLQTGGYADAQPGDEYTDRWAVLLKPDGTYRLKRLSDPNDINTFLAMTIAHKWGVDHGKYRANEER